MELDATKSNGCICEHLHTVLHALLNIWHACQDEIVLCCRVKGGGGGGFKHRIKNLYKGSPPPNVTWTCTIKILIAYMFRKLLGPPCL